MSEFSPVFERWMEVSLVLAFVIGCTSMITPMLFLADTRLTKAAGVCIIAVAATFVTYRTACYVLYGL